MFFVSANIPKKNSRHTIVFWGYVWVVSTFNRVWIDQVWGLPIPLEGTRTRNIFYLSSPFALANLVSESINDWGGYADSVPGEVTKKQNFRRYDPLHCRQACPEFNSSHQGVR